MAKKHKESELQNLPVCAAEFIKLVIKNMRYRKKVRADVMAELASHFEDELRDCKTDEEKEQKTKGLIGQFGDAKLLGILLRRAKKRCRPLWRTIIVKVFQIIGIFILCFIIYCVYISLGKPTININYVDEATRLVRPVADESLNAAPLYQKALDAYKEEPLVKDETGTKDIKLLDAVNDKEWITELTEEELVLMKQWLSDNTEAVELFKKAVEKPYCWWQREAKDNFILDFLLPELKHIRNMVKMIVWQAKLKAYDGHTTEAFDDLLICYRAGKHFKGPRGLIDQLVGMGIQGISIGSCFAILDNQNVDSQLLKDLQVRLEELMAEDIFTINYKVERFLGLDFLQRCYTDNGIVSGHMIPEQLARFIHRVEGMDTPEGMRLSAFALSVAGANRREMAREFDKVYDTAQKLAYKTPCQLHEENVDFEINVYSWSTLKKARYWPVYYLMPALNAINRNAYYHKTYVDALITTLAIIRFEQSTGNCPENLDELVTAGYLKSLPTDPWSDKPLVYKRTDDGFMLYGIGSNFADDGGEVARDNKGRVKKRAKEGDWVFWPVQESEIKK